MTVSEQHVARLKRWRGAMLGYVYSGLHDAEHRLDDLGLWGMMQDFGHGIGLNQLRALLYEMHDADYLAFEQTKNNRTGETHISKIQVTPRGCKIMEKLLQDESILVL